jgi:hypothetical protein
MTRRQLEHPDAHPELLVSNEADVFPRHHPERSDLIDGASARRGPDVG